MANNQMKPCPFCGSSAVYTPSLSFSEIGCGAGRGCSVVPAVRRATFTEAQRAWNFRSPKSEEEPMAELTPPHS